MDQQIEVFGFAVHARFGYLKSLSELVHYFVPLLLEKTVVQVAAGSDGLDLKVFLEEFS